jgi:hypothetical protein
VMTSLGNLWLFTLILQLEWSWSLLLTKKGTDDAIYYLANKMHGHIVGVVMRKVIRCKSKTGRDIDQYEIAWEYTSLGESTVSGTHLSAASIVGCHLDSLWQQSSNHCTKDGNRFASRTSRRAIVSRAVSSLTSWYSDDESCDGAPSSDNDTMTSMAIDNESSDEDSNEQDKDNFLDWIVFGDNNFHTSPIGNHGTGDNSPNVDECIHDDGEDNMTCWLDYIGIPCTKLMNPPPAFQEEVVQYTLNMSICSKRQLIPFLHLSHIYFGKYFATK